MAPTIAGAGDDQITSLPLLRTWRSVYILVAIVFVVWVVLCRAAEDVFVNVLDYVILLGTMLASRSTAFWRTRGRRDLKTYLRATATRDVMIGLSVMATQASAITFLSTPGRGTTMGWGSSKIISALRSR